MNGNNTIEVEYDNQKIDIPAESMFGHEVTAVYEFEGELRVEYDAGEGKVREAAVGPKGSLGDLLAAYDPHGTLEDIGATVLYDNR